MIPTNISTLWNLRPPRADRESKAVIHRCDICDDIIPEASDNFEAQIQVLDEIDNSFESELDKSTYLQGPKLILCDYCQKNTCCQVILLLCAYMPVEMLTEAFK